MTQRILVVGGTGMLAAATHALAQPQTEVTCIARSRARLDALEAWAKARGSLIRGVSLDYRDTAAIDDAIAPLGPFDLGVFWIHSVAPEAPQHLARFIRGRLIHILGSAGASPTADLKAQRAPFVAMDHLTQYHQLVLGFVVEDNRSRWLTHAEISEGVLHAIANPTDVSVVGQVEPWALKP